MPTNDSIEVIIERCLDILSPETNTDGPSKTLNEHVIEIGLCVKDLNNLVRDLDNRVILLERVV